MKVYEGLTQIVVRHDKIGQTMVCLVGGGTGSSVPLMINSNLKVYFFVHIFPLLADGSDPTKIYHL